MKLFVYSLAALGAAAVHAIRIVDAPFEMPLADPPAPPTLPQPTCDTAGLGNCAASHLDSMLKCSDKDCVCAQLKEMVTCFKNSKCDADQAMRGEYAQVFVPAMVSC